MNKTIVQIQSHLEMVGFIKANGTACRFVSMVSETPVKNIRAACPYKGVMKISRKRGMINVNYVASVERKIAAKLGVEPKEVEYTPGEVWYEHLTTIDGKALPLVINKKKGDGEYYLQYFPTSSENVYKMPSGEFIAEELLKPYFYAKKETSYKPVVISINVANIKELRASGVIMQAEDLEAAEKSLDEVSVSFADDSKTQAQSLVVA